MPMSAIELSKVQRVELGRRTTSQEGRADDARRARLILLLDAVDMSARTRDKLSWNDAFIGRWSKCFAQERLARPFSRYAGRESSTLTAVLEARILESTIKRKPSDGSTQWSSRSTRRITAASAVNSSLGLSCPRRLTQV